MRKLAYLLIFLLIATPTIAAADQPVVMNVKIEIYHNPNLQMGKTLYQELYKNHQRQGKITRCQTLQSMWWLKPII